MEKHASIIASLICLCMQLRGCATPPLVQPADGVGPSAWPELPDAEPIEARTDDGVVLWGLFLPGPAEDAPIVLHLLPSGASIGTGVSAGVGRVSLAPTLRSLAQLGFGSLVFDYRGVGESSGQRTALNLREDGQAMWRRAVQLAGGRQEQIVVRAGSLGTLVAANLIDSDAQPRAMVLIAPIQASTINRNAARAHSGELRGSLRSMIFRRVDIVDLRDVVEGVTTPSLWIVPQEDDYLTSDERREILHALNPRFHTVVEYHGDHHATVLRSWGFTLDLANYSGRATPELLPEESAFLEGMLIGQ